jgi:hypothetical protein
MLNGRTNQWHRIYIVIAALAFGAITSAVNHGFGPASAYTSKVLGNDWAWLVAIAAATATGDRWQSSARAGARFVVPSVIAYYVTDLASGTYTSLVPPPPGSQAPSTGIDLIGAVSDTIAYLIIGTAASGVLSLVLVLIRRGGLIGFIALEALPLYIAKTAFSRADHVIPADPIAERTFTGVGIAALAAAGILALVYGATRSLRSISQRPAHPVEPTERPPTPASNDN